MKRCISNNLIRFYCHLSDRLVLSSVHNFLTPHFSTSVKLMLVQVFYRFVKSNIRKQIGFLKFRTAH
jgi:hypothetical protein